VYGNIRDVKIGSNLDCVDILLSQTGWLTYRHWTLMGGSPTKTIMDIYGDVSYAQTVTIGNYGWFSSFPKNKPGKYVSFIDTPGQNLHCTLKDLPAVVSN
jgi:hypothetical protein